MDTLTFDATRFIRPALRASVLYISIIMVSLIAMVKPAQASGTVPMGQIWGASLNGMGLFCYGPTLSASVACFAQYQIQNPNSYYVDGYCHTPVSTVMTSATYAIYTYTLSSYPGCTGYINTHANTFQVLSTACPAHSKPTGSTCTCNDNYVPSGTTCIPEINTIALHGLGVEVMPNTTLDAHAEVTTSSGSPKSGAQVSLSLDVVPVDDGLPYAPHVGSVSPNGGATGTDGRLPFVFTAPVAGGTHTITATCTNCTNQATGTIKVPGCPVPALTAPPFNDACAEVLENLSSTQAQKDAACGALTDKLKTGMACFRDKLSGLSPAIPLKITSDIRDVAYQAHLREIWDRMQALVQLEGDPVKRAACADRRAEIAAEKGCDNAGRCTSCYSESATQRSHCLKGRPANPSPNDAQHTQGNAFDVSEDYTITPLQDVLEARNPPQTISKFLDAPTNCNLIWGGTFITNYDPVHFYAP